MTLRCEYHCRIISRSFVFVFFLNSFLTLKCLWNFQLKILIPFSELSLYAKLASRLPNWKHLDGILNLGHPPPPPICPSLEERKSNPITSHREEGKTVPTRAFSFNSCLDLTSVTLSRFPVSTSPSTRSQWLIRFLKSSSFLLPIISVAPLSAEGND